uniref:Uncharacterized protein n=1 Tax=Helianthus annuus TaxID=4232 RepID=A0A251U933_HELAN
MRFSRRSSCSYVCLRKREREREREPINRSRRQQTFCFYISTLKVCGGNENWKCWMVVMVEL